MTQLPVDNEGEFGVEIRDAPPAHLLMKIESFSVLSKHEIEKYKSREFVAGNYKWRFIIHPQVSGGNDISVYLSVSDTESLPDGWEVNANCSILLHNQISNKYLCFHGKERRFDATNSSWGFSISKKMVLDPSNGFLVDDKCVFGAEVILSKTTAVIEYLSLFDFSKFGRLFEGMCSPFVIIFKWQERIMVQILNNKLYLWFRKMKLYPNGNDNAKGDSVSIYLECVDAEDFAPDERVEAVFGFRIKNKLPSHAHTSEYSKGFVVDDCCIIEAKISVQYAVYKPDKKPKVQMA